MKKILFAVATHNLSETIKALEVAKSCGEQFNFQFMGYGGKFRHLITDAGFDYHLLEPALTDSKIEQLLKVENLEMDLNKVDQLDLDQNVFSQEELLHRVKSESDLIKSLTPAVIVTGFCLSTSLSSKFCQVPLVRILPSVGIKSFYEAGLGIWPDSLDLSYTQLIPQKFLDRWASKRVLPSSFFTVPFNEVARYLNVPIFKSFFDILEADMTLLTDVPQMTGLINLPDNYHYIGPILSQLEKTAPPELDDLPTDKPIVYFPLEGIDDDKIVDEVIEGISRTNYYIIITTPRFSKSVEINARDNMMIIDWLPPHVISDYADISIIQGDQENVYAACMSGTPIVGIGSKYIYQSNLECVVRKGFALRIPPRSLTGKKVVKTLKRLSRNREAKRKILEFKQFCQNLQGSITAAKVLYEKFGG